MKRLLPVMLLVTMLTLGLGARLTHAQAGIWPLTIADVFDPSIEVRLVEPTYPEQEYYADNEFRLLVIDGEIVPFPDELLEVASLASLFDGRTLVYARVQEYQLAMLVYEQGQFTEFFSPCPDFDPYMDIATEPWRIVQDEQDAYLCNYVTGQRSERLPDGYRYPELPEDRTIWISTSPDQDWVVFGAGTGEQLGTRWSTEVDILSYEVATGELRNLGDYRLATYSWLDDDWYGTQILLANSEPGNISTTSYSIVDAARPDSLEPVMSGAFNIRPVDDPPRLFAGYDERQPESFYCGRTVYDIATRTTTRLNLNGLCRPEVGDIEAVGYYRDVPTRPMYGCCDLIPAEVPTVPMIRYDTRTGDWSELFSGEIEWINWVSADERYGIVTIDDNGVVNLAPYQPVFSWYTDVTNPHHTLIDLERGAALVSTRLTGDHWYESNETGYLPIDDRRFVRLYCDLERELCDRYFERSASLITITDGVVEEETLIRFVAHMLTPDRRGVLYWQEADSPRGLSGLTLLDIEDRTERILTQPLNTERYETFLAGGDQNVVLTIRPTFPVGGYPDGISFTIGFEDGEPIILEYLPSDPMGGVLCVLRTEVGVNLRALPGGNQELFGAARINTRLSADGQAVSDYDGMTWWRLGTGGWVRSDFVYESPPCADVPVVDPLAPEATPEATAGVVVQIVSGPPGSTGPTCTITALQTVPMRSGPGLDYEQIASAVEGQALEADGQYFNEDEYFRWWHLTTGEWLREDVVREGEGCDDLPAADPTGLVAAPTLTTFVTGQVCTVTVLQGVYLRSAPRLDAEQIGSAAADTELSVSGQYYNAEDYFTWWQLITGEWLREDVVREEDYCDSLPVVEISE
jgi:hypothetical protein